MIRIDIVLCVCALVHSIEFAQDAWRHVQKVPATSNRTDG